MILNSRFRKTGTLLAAAAAISGCTVNLPPPPAPNPADPSTAAAPVAPHRPTLLASSRSFLVPATETREKGTASLSNRTEPSLASSASATVYTCPMHPEVQETKSGNCPICGMTLAKKAIAPEGAKP